MASGVVPDPVGRVTAQLGVGILPVQDVGNRKLYDGVEWFHVPDKYYLISIDKSCRYITISRKFCYPSPQVLVS